jgi:hypothetical protein
MCIYACVCVHIHEIIDTTAPPTDLVGCLENVDKEALLLRLPGYRFQGANGENLAAAKIQATWNMRRTRKLYLEYRRLSFYASVIQVCSGVKQSEV